MVDVVFKNVEPEDVPKIIELLRKEKKEVKKEEKKDGHHHVHIL